MPTHPIIAPKKLIEVALPLDAINKACAREKSIRHGHPSTLHLWWARRPLAAARAVLFAQLVNDPSWKYSEEELKKPQVKSAITRKRNELFKLLSELVPWESTANDAVLERARQEIRASWRETCDANKAHPDAAALFNRDHLPAFHDPFAGGGTIPLEAQRLGLDAYASDLNPVAVLINRAMIEIPPKFAGRPPVGPLPASDKQTKTGGAEGWVGAQGLAEDVRRYGLWMRDEAERSLGHLYPKLEVTKEMAKDRPDLKPLAGQRLTVIAWLWARTIKSPNPAFSDVDVPLVSGFILASKKGKEAYVEPVVEKRAFRFVVRVGVPPKGAEDGTKLGRGANFRCVMSGSPITPEYVKSEASAGRMGARLMAVVAEGSRARIYISPRPHMEELAGSAAPSWRPTTLLPDDPRNFWTLAYGLREFADLFTSRQLVALNEFSDLVQRVVARCRADAVTAGVPDDDVPLSAGGKGARAYAEAVGTYLGMSVARYANAASSICTWNPGEKKEDIRFTFARQAVPMTWDFAEGNPFSESSGNFGDNIETWLYKAIRSLQPSAGGASFQADAAGDEWPVGQPVISTDPPYYDNISYADLSDFFYVWLRRSLRPIFGELFATLAVPKREELVASPYRHGGKEKADEFFLTRMTTALRKLARRARPDFPVTVYYAFKQSDTAGDEGTASTGWETFLTAVFDSGFAVAGTWPMRTERDGRSIGVGTNALASSIILVCRPRAADASRVARKDFLRQLERALPAALAEMTADPIAAIAPVDLAQAAIGPGMAIFSKYSAVLEADGSSMSVHSALVHINKAIDNFFSEAEGDLDADTRFCIAWFQQYGFDLGPFGEADVLARAKGTAVDGVQEAGVLAATKGKVRLLRVKDYPAKWDPTTDSRVPVWEACHQMCRALAESEHEAGALLARMPEKQDAIRQLAYRLYTIGERQKWAEEARSYNELVTSWPAIVEESLKAGLSGAQLELVPGAR